MRFYLFFVLIITVHLSFSQVRIKGNIQSFSKVAFANETFTVEKITDFITYQKTEIARGTTDDFGNFDLQVPLPTTAFLFLNFEKVERTFYAVPSKSYFINIQAPLEELKASNGIFVKDVRAAKLVNTHLKELNYLIDTLDYACSKFLQENPVARKDKKQVDAFIGTLQVAFVGYELPYFKDYLKFKEAELLMFIYRSKKSEFALKFFNHEKDLSSHIQKMQVFRSFYKGNLKHRILIDDNSPFHKAFNSGNLTRCLDLIDDNPDSELELRELLLLYGIYEVHGQNRYSLKSVNRILDALIETSTSSNHRLIAKNIKAKITHLKEGYPAPNIIVKKNAKNNEFNLRSIKNKYVYLCFFTTWDESFNEELELLKIIAKKYEKELEIVCVGTDDDLVKFNEIKGKYGADWRFVHYNFQTNILMDYNIEEYRIDRYDIETMAKYYLIDPDGDLVFSPAKSPTKGFHKDFQRIIAQ